MAAVRHLHIRSGYDLDLKKFLRLQWICRGIKRSQGDSTRIQLPITINHLKLFFQLLAIPTTTNYDSIMIWAGMTLAFFWFPPLGRNDLQLTLFMYTPLVSRGYNLFPQFSKP